MHHATQEYTEWKTPHTEIRLRWENFAFVFVFQTPRRTQQNQRYFFSICLFLDSWCSRNPHKAPKNFIQIQSDFITIIILETIKCNPTQEKLSLHPQYQPLLQVSSQIAGKRLQTLKYNNDPLQKLVDMANYEHPVCVRTLTTHRGSFLSSFLQCINFVGLLLRSSF